MVLRIRELSQAEKSRLQAWLHAQDEALRHRARVILLSAEGHRIPEIAKMVGANPANLRKWIHRFNERSCAGLLTRRSGGAKPRFSEEQKRRIVALARSKPHELGLNFTSWTLHRLAEEARQRRIVDRISHEYVRQILKAANCSYKQLGR
jgi:transposase